MKMGGTAHHEQVSVARPLAACLTHRDHDHVAQRFEALANGIGDRVRVAEHRLVDDYCRIVTSPVLVGRLKRPHAKNASSCEGDP